MVQVLSDVTPMEKETKERSVGVVLDVCHRAATEPDSCEFIVLCAGRLIVKTSVEEIQDELRSKPMEFR
jgi:hypothetical protein